MSEQANNGQGNTDTVNADANVTTANDTVAGATQATGEDTQPGATGNETVEGAAGADTIEGAGGEDTLEGADKDDKGKEGEGKDGDKPTEVDAYEFVAPEGVTLDTELVTEFTAIAKELKLPQDEAQKIVDLGPKIMQKFADAQAQIVVDAQAKWRADTLADKEIGGDNLEQNLALSRKALDTFGTPELKTLLAESGLGNHPEVIRVFNRIGKGISNDGLVTGKAVVNTPTTLANKLYPNHKP